MILCLTVGGVYATWTFTQTTDIDNGDTEYILSLTDKSSVGNYGEYTIDVSVEIVIDQANSDETGRADNPLLDHQAVLRVSDDSEIVVTFTPSEAAPHVVKEASFPTYFYITLSNDMKAPIATNGHYDAEAAEKDVFVISCLGDENPQPISWDPKENADDPYTYTFNAAAIRELIQLNGTIILDTVADYEAFEEDIAGTIFFHVEEGVIPAS